MISRKWKPWLVLSLIFLVGMVAGGALTLALGPILHGPPGEAEMRHNWMSHLTHRLNLTPDQQAKIQPILTNAANQIQAMHREEVGRISQILERTNAEIAPLLTPEQQNQLLGMQREMEKDRDRMIPGRMHPWGPPHGGPGGMRPPPPPFRGGPDDMMPLPPTNAPAATSTSRP